MVMNTETTKISSQIGIYRAKITPIDRLLKTTVGRKAMLEDLIEKLDRNAGKKGGQHYLFIGPRGIGKTHFLTLIENTVNEDERLKTLYTVIRFPEENNRILSFADLLLGIVEILGDVTDDEEWKKLYTSLSEIEKDEEIIDTIIPRLKHYHKKTGKTLLIFVENLDTLFTEQIKNEQDIHRLRSFLMDSPCAALVGTSPVYFAGLSNVKSPLYDFFDVQILEDLSEEQTLKMIRKNLKWEKRNYILKNFDSLVPKIKALHMMTGGNPRLIIILYELIANDNLMEVKIQFQELLDRISPFYQERMKDLAPQERALLETMALMRTEPCTPANIAKQLRKPPQQTSSLLNRMTKAGYLTVSENPRDKRSRLYRIKEGFFDLWLAMSESRVQKKRLIYLVEFLEMYYRDPEDREKKRTELWEGLKEETKKTVKKENHFELLDYLSEIGDTFERCQSKLELAVHKLKEGDAKEAEGFLKEVESISPKSQTFTWMTAQARQMAEGGLDFDVSKWLDEMIEYWRTQRSGDLEKTIAIAHKLGKDFSRHGLHKIRIELLSDVLKHTVDPREKHKLYNEMAKSQKTDGQLSAALTSLRNALNICTELLDKKTEGVILNNISHIYSLQGDYETSLKYLEISLKISTETGDEVNKGVVLNTFGTIYHNKGEYELALNYFNDSLKTRKKIGDKKGKGTTLNNISQIYYVRGDYDAALKYLIESLSIRKEIGDKNGEGVTLNNIGEIYFMRGNYDTALKYLEESLSIRKEIGDKNSEGVTLNNISQIYHMRSDYDTALKYLEKALRIMKEVGDKNSEGILLSNIGGIYHAKGDYDMALKYLEDSSKVERDIADPIYRIVALHNMAMIELQRKKTDRVLAIEMEAYKLAVETGNAMGLFQVGKVLGNLLIHGGQQEEGIEMLQRSYKIGLSSGLPGTEKIKKKLLQLGKKIE